MYYLSYGANMKQMSIVVALVLKAGLAVQYANTHNTLHLTTTSNTYSLTKFLNEQLSNFSQSKLCIRQQVYTTEDEWCNRSFKNKKSLENEGYETLKVLTLSRVT